MLFHAYFPFSVKSKTVTVPSFVVCPSSCGAPTNTVLSIAQTPLPKLSIAVTLSVINLSSITNFVLYIVAVYAPPDCILLSTINVSCRSNVVSPKSIFISRGLAKLSAPITNLVPTGFIASDVPNFMLICESGALTVCCSVYVFVDPSAFHL